MACNRTPGGIDMPEGWWSEGGLVFATDNFEEDVRIVRRRPDLNAVGPDPENMILWCAMEDGEIVEAHNYLHDAFRVFEEDWIAPGEAAMMRSGPMRG